MLLNWWTPLVIYISFVYKLEAQSVEKMATTNYTTYEVMELEERNIYLNCVSIKPNGVLDVSLFILLCYGEYKGNDTKYTTMYNI